MKFDRVVSVYILNSDNKILMLNHPKFNRWLPPGGHVENNELMHKAAIREVREETGLEIEFLYKSLDNYLLNNSNDAKQLPTPTFVQLEDLKDHYHEDFVYIARAKTTEIYTDEKHEIGWFTLDEALKLDIFDNVAVHLMYIKDNI